MKAKIISKLTIAQLACLPLISISCGKHEQKAKENLVAVARDPKFDKLIDKNKEEKTNKTAPIVEKIEVVNNDESESKHIEKNKKVEIKNPNNPNSSINIEVKNDIKIDNKINTKENKLKTFFAVIGGLATAAAVGYGIYWLFKDNEIISITSQTQTSETKTYSNFKEQITVTIEFEDKTNISTFKVEVHAKAGNGFVIINERQQHITSNGKHNGSVTLTGSKWFISEVTKKYISKITNYKKEEIKNWQKLLLKFEDWISSFKPKNKNNNK